MFVQDSGGVRLTLCELCMNTPLLGVECLCPGSVCGWVGGGGGLCVFDRHEETNLHADSTLNGCGRCLCLFDRQMESGNTV